MDIQIIDENIKELEMGDTTFDTVQELAFLYIVKANFKSSIQTMVEREYDDILPAYKKYVEAKRQFQFNQADETSMLKYLQLLCNEIQEFILSLYSSTNMRKERHYIVETLTKLSEIIAQ